MAEYRVNFSLGIRAGILYLKRRPDHQIQDALPVVFIPKATQTNEMHGECHGLTFSCTFLYRKTFRKQSHWICRRQLTLWDRSTVPVLVIRKMWARKHFDCLFRHCDRPNCFDCIANMWMNSDGVTIAFLSLPSLTRPQPFTGTDRTCNRQRVQWVRSPDKGVVRQTARHCILLADEISI